MGNYKFRLSDMIPNAWFYKLKDMSKTRRNKNNINVVSQKPQHHRKSFYYTWESSSTRPAAADVYFYNFPAATDPNPPRISSSKRRSRSRSRTRRKTVYKPSPRRPVPAAALLQDDDYEEESAAPNSPGRNYSDSSSSSSTGTDVSLELFDLLKYEAPNNNGTAGTESRSSNCSCGFSSSAATTTTAAADIIIDINEKCFNNNNKLLLFDDTIPELDLPPILTKPTNESSTPPPPPPSVKTVKCRKETSNPGNGLRGTTTVTGIKLRANSPKVGSKKIQGHGKQGRNRGGGGRKSISSSRKKGFSESFAVVKASFDPEKDFRESMMEMILENKIRDSKDLEDLLACYLSLNSDEYHHLIINAFEQIWFNIPHLNF